MLDKVNVLAAIEKARKGITQDAEVMSMLYCTDVSRDREFQRKYNAFYRVQHRPKDWYLRYYAIMENGKCGQSKFDSVLDQMKSKLGRYEPSFASKLVATLNPWMPVWDQHVLKNTKLKEPVYTSPNKINDSKETYKKL